MSRTHKAEELAGVLHVDLKNKPYKEQEPMVPNVGEPVVVYTGNENNPNIVTEGRDDIRHAISGEELLDRLCPRIKALFG